VRIGRVVDPTWVRRWLGDTGSSVGYRRRVQCTRLILLLGRRHKQVIWVFTGVGIIISSLLNRCTDITICWTNVVVQNMSYNTYFMSLLYRQPPVSWGINVRRWNFGGFLLYSHKPVTILQVRFDILVMFDVILFFLSRISTFYSSKYLEKFWRYIV